MWSCLRRKISSKALTLISSSSWSSVSITIEIILLLSIFLYLHLVAQFCIYLFFLLYILTILLDGI